MSPALLAWALTVIVEVTVVAWVYAGERLRMALACAVATTATNLTMNLVLFPNVRSITSYLLIGEIGAVVIEAAVYFAVSKERDIGRALIASAIANNASFAAGMLLW